MGGYAPPPGGQSTYIRYLKFLCTDLSTLPDFSFQIYFFVIVDLHPVFLYISMDSGMFILYLGFNPVPYFLAQVVPALATGSSLTWFPCPFDMSLSVCVCVFKSTFLFSGAVRCSSSILYVSYLGLVIGYFSRELWFPLLEKVMLETKIWALDVLVLLRVKTSQLSADREPGNKWV